MRVRPGTVLPTALLAALCLALWGPVAQAAGFGIASSSIEFTDPEGGPDMQAGSHPFAFTTDFAAQTRTEGEPPGEVLVPDDEFKDVDIDLPPGLVGTPTPVPRCSSADFLTILSGTENACPDSSAVGLTEIAVSVGAVPADAEDLFFEPLPVYNLEPPPGVAAKLGFTFLPGLPVTIEVGVSPDPPYNLQAHVTNIPQAALFYASSFTVWGVPAAAGHDAERGKCALSAASCPADLPEIPFLTMPRDCGGPLQALFRARSWQQPGAWVASSAQTATGVSGCEKLDFALRIGSQTTSRSASSPSGLDFSIEIDDEGLTDPGGVAASDIRKAVVALPAGVSANPSLAAGLQTCDRDDLARETASSAPGEGCPQASKIGTVEVQTPLLEGALLRGQVFLATPDDPARPGAENPFDSLLALYMVIRDPGLGILVRLAGRVDPDPRDGRLTTTFGEPGHEIPRFPFSRFRFHFREGGRSPLVTPPGCGTYRTEADFYPWADPSAPLRETATFQIDSGPGGGPCPPPGAPPFEPGFQAGTLNNAAGRFSPFLLRLTRRDGDQDLTRFAAGLPPGLVARLAGVRRCAETSIAAARAHSGRAELASPGCPQDSRIGSLQAGAGVGSQLTYVPGSLYLAGPFNGAPLSVVGVVPAVAGPFDVGTVVVRQALRVDPRSARVEVDGSASEPIPHILAGIPLAVRDIRAAVDRPGFTLNPTGCDPFAIDARLWGGGADPFSAADDAPVAREDRFQAAGCARLGFSPRLALRLRGGARRGAHPALRGVYRPRPGQANLSRLVLRLPRSAFLEQAHIRTICTRVQFAAAACPRGAVYGHARAYSPLLEEPLAGPVYLRSSDHDLPDLVAALHGLIEIEAVARIDSVRGGIRATFQGVPDAPISRVVVQMQGGRKGLIVNSTALCRKRHRARALLLAHNAARRALRPQVRPGGCGR